MASTKELFVVYKRDDELYNNLLRKYIESSGDDQESETTVETIDKSIVVISMDEKHWLANKIGDISTQNKVLFIGNIKGNEKSLNPIIDYKYEKYGIKYGWAGNQAVLFVDTDIDDSNYKFFLKEAQSVMDLHSPIQIGEKTIEILKEMLKSQTIPLALFNWRRNAIINAIMLANFSIHAYKENSQARLKQRYCYGIYLLYLNDLQKFMNA